MPSVPKPTVIHFEAESETKRKQRYSETKDGVVLKDGAVIGRLYVDKATAKRYGDKIKITIERDK